VLTLCFQRSLWSNTNWFCTLCIKAHCRAGTTTSTTTATAIWHPGRLYTSVARRGLYVCLPLVPASSSSTASSQPSTSYPSERERERERAVPQSTHIHTFTRTSHASKTTSRLSRRRGLQSSIAFNVRIKLFQWQLNGRSNALAHFPTFSLFYPHRN